GADRSGGQRLRRGGERPGAGQRLAAGQLYVLYDADVAGRLPPVGLIRTAIGNGASRRRRSVSLPHALKPRRQPGAVVFLSANAGSSQPEAPGANRLRASCKRLSGDSAPAPALPNLRRSRHPAAVTP